MRCLLLLTLLGAAPAIAGERIGDIEFFGYKGLDPAKLRESLPVHEGDEYSDQTKGRVRQALTAGIGKEPTDVAAICCDEKGNRLLFIGLAGASYKNFAYNSEPAGDERLSPEVMDLAGRLDEALVTAVRRGGGAAEEDDSNGYALLKDRCQVPANGHAPMGGQT